MTEVMKLNGFSELTQYEMELMDGGNIFEVFVGSLLVAAGGVATIIGVGVAVGTGGTAIVPGLEFATAGVATIDSGTALIKKGLN